MTVLRGAIFAAAALALLINGAALGQPLYVGDQEFDTANEADMATLLDRCENLAANSPNADRATRFTAVNHQSTPPIVNVQQTEAPVALEAESQEKNEGPVPLTIDLDSVTSAGDGAQPAGEGAGEGVEPPGDDAVEGQDDTVIDVDAITLEACKEAGIL